MAFSATESAFEGFRLARRAPVAILLWALFYMAATAVIVIAFGPMFVDFFQTVEALETSGAEPTMQDVAPLLTFYAVLIPGAILVSSVIYGAVNRAVLRPSESAFGYLRLGGDELRIIGLSIILTLLFVGVLLGLGTVVALIAGLLATIAGDVAAFVVFPLFIVVYGVAIWLAIRFSLAVPITVAERRIAVFDSWRLTRGHFWSLLGMTLLSAVMAMVVYVLLALVAMPVFFFAIGGFENLEALEAMAPIEIMTNMAPFAIAAMVFYGLVSSLMAAISYAPFASAYLGLTGRSGDPEPSVDPTPAPAPSEPEL